VKTETLLLLALVGVGGYLLLSRRKAVISSVSAPSGGATAGALPGQVSTVNPWASLASQIVATLGSYGSPAASSGPELLNTY